MKIKRKLLMKSIFIIKSKFVHKWDTNLVLFDRKCTFPLIETTKKGTRM